MEFFKISGPTEYEGSVKVQGSKNAVLPMMAAAVAVKGVTVLKNCPDISDVHSAADILRELGCTATFSDGVLTIDSSMDLHSKISASFMGRLRASFIFTGALLARCKEFTASKPGGCNIGLRPVDIHLNALRDLGAVIELSPMGIRCRADELKPCSITLRFPSVGATENIMILAACLNGTTRIINAAREPEIEDLQNMLNACGAHINGAGSSVIVIEGSENLHGTCYEVMPDRIDTATYLSAVACSKGRLTITDAKPMHLINYINLLKGCGMDISFTDGTIYAEKKNRLKGSVNVSTMPYPGFATDMQSLLMSVLSVSEGVSLIKENIFENRFCMSETLCNMGADIRIYRHTASVRGVRNLMSAHGSVCDLRSGAALAIAMMGAKGTSQLSDICYIDRGYEYFEEKYKSIGAHIERVEDIE